MKPEKRLEAYKWALKSIDFYCYPFLCILLKRWYIENMNQNKKWDGNWVFKTFPEFGSKQPKKLPFTDGTRWFEDNEKGNVKRAALLRKCIVEVKKIIPKQ